MAFSFLHISAPTFKGIKERFSKISEPDFIAYSLIGVSALLIFLLLYDGYLFYATVLGERAPILTSSQKHSPLSSRDLDEVIGLLDLRQQEFDEILNK